MYTSYVPENEFEKLKILETWNYKGIHLTILNKNPLFKKVCKAIT